MKKDYLYTTIHKSVADFVVEPDSIYLYGKSAEERSHFVDQLIARNISDINFIQIKEIDNERIENVETGTEYF